MKDTIEQAATEHAKNRWGKIGNDIVNYGTGETNADISKADFITGAQYGSKEKEEVAIKFVEWIGNNRYTKHQVNDRWYDTEINEHNFLGSTQELLKIFQDANHIQ